MRESVIIVIFDLSFESANNKREYLYFRKWLKTNGYMMCQYSIYVKSIKNLSMATKEYEKLKINAPQCGNVMAWKTSERNFRAIQQIRGQKFDIPLLCDKFLVIE